MSKIVSAVNAMILRSDRINPAILGEDGEVFFTYDSKYNWSIKQNEDDFVLWFYPGSGSVEALARQRSWDEDIPVVVYKASQTGGREAKDTFRELYTIVREKVFGLDDVLKDIIDGADDIPF
jgi:hypothetical protein